MKKTLWAILTISLGVPFSSNAQWVGSSPIYYNSGFVGIGTATPKAELHISGAIVAGGGVANLDPAIPSRNPSFLINTGQMYIGWNRTSGGGETDFISNQGGGGIGGFAFYNYSNSGLETQLMWIQANGNIGIGTTDTKGFKLAVNGSAIAESVTVKLYANWPDYVFKPAYNLRPLAEVKSFIIQNQRLPDMPSEQEVAKNGINLGEMVRLQTKKIEELTLYLLKENETKQVQQKEIDELRKQVKVLLKKKRIS